MHDGADSKQTNGRMRVFLEVLADAPALEAVELRWLLRGIIADCQWQDSRQVGDTVIDISSEGT